MKDSVTHAEPTPEHCAWHMRMWDLGGGATVFFIDSQFTKHAYLYEKEIGSFNLLANKEV